MNKEELFKNLSDEQKGKIVELMVTSSGIVLDVYKSQLEQKIRDLTEEDFDMIASFYEINKIENLIQFIIEKLDLKNPRG